MNEVVAAPRASLVITFAHGGNSDAFVGEGWYGCEPRHRWSAGGRSVLRLPPFAPSRRFTLTLECHPLRLAGVRQSLAIEFNGVSLGVIQPNGGIQRSVAIPGDIVIYSGENTLALLNPDALVPAEHSPDNRDGRRLAFAWTRLEFAPDDTDLFERAELLAEPDMTALQTEAVANLYQSLGQNCELGMFQRRCGAEPIGLLRFASIFPDRLLQGLRTRFQGLATVEALSLVAGEPGGELMGHHAVYGLSYHTFKYENEVDVAEFKLKESRRLGYLARLFLEQLENDEKIFVRRGDFETEGEFRSLYRMLRSFNPEARLMMVQEAPERAGRVERLAPNLYRGFLSKFADPNQVPSSLVYEDWLKICAKLYDHQRRAGRVVATL